MSNDPAIYVIEDDPAVLDSLQLLLVRAGHKVLGFTTAEQFLESERSTAGCVVSDVRLPGLSGLELMKRLKVQGSTQPVVFITGHGDIDMAVTAIKDGAFDFIEKPFNPQRLLASVTEALEAAEQRRVAPALETDPALAARVADLSERQRQVMSLVAAGKSNKEVAATLGISPRTVEVYRAHVMSKLGVKTMADLVKIALKSGIMD